MNLNLPEKEKVSKKTIVIYIISITICILALIIVISVQVLGNDIINSLFGINKIIKRTEQEELALKLNFENIFNNQIENVESHNIQKISNNEELIYTSYKKQEKNDKYEINVNLPFINIQNKEIQDFNQEITDTFEAKSERILNSENENVIYTVKYQANIEKDILSLIIYSDLKQETSAQRTIIQTFNFSLKEKRKICLEETIKIYKLNENEVQNKINKDIKEAQEKSDDLKELGYNVFSRDINSEIYKVKNIKEFFIYKNYIYIIFAYGNNSLTTEKDIVII